MLKALAEVSPYTTTQDSRQILPNVVQLLKVCMFKLFDKYQSVSVAVLNYVFSSNVYVTNEIDICFNVITRFLCLLRSTCPGGRLEKK